MIWDTYLCPTTWTIGCPNMVRFWARLVEIQVFSISTNYMLISFGFSLLIYDILYIFFENYQHHNITKQLDDGLIHHFACRKLYNTYSMSAPHSWKILEKWSMRSPNTWSHRRQPRSWVMLRCCDFSKLNGPIVPSDQITQFKDGLPNLPHSSMGMGVENVITFIMMMHLLILYTGWSNSSSSKNIMGPWKQGIR